MRRKIPSTGSLIAFEVAARHQNFSRAALELSITESAISKQIAILEDYLGLALFHRQKKRVKLTDIGRQYFQQVQEDLNRLERNTLDAMAYQGGNQVIELAVIPTFACKWLIPRLPEFYRLHPDIRVNLTDTPKPFLFAETVFDAALHFSHPSWGSNKFEVLFDEELYPVCSPKLLNEHAISSPADLGKLPLIHKTSRENLWPLWFSEAGCNSIDEIPMHGPRFNLFSMIEEAALCGLGVALIPSYYVTAHLKAGTLVSPFRIPINGLKQYCLVFPDHKPINPALQNFRLWVLDLARETIMARLGT